MKLLRLSNRSRGRPLEDLLQLVLVPWQLPLHSPANDGNQQVPDAVSFDLECNRHARSRTLIERLDRASHSAACAERHLALHEFGWQPAMGRAGLQRDALYLLRPDGFVALTAPEQSAPTLIAYLEGALGNARVAPPV